MTALLKSTCKAGILVAACVSLALCASCTDKEALEGYAETDVLSFGVSVSNEWNPYTGTRSKAGEMPERSAFKFDNSDMWLIATSEQKMDTTLFCKPKTRAAAVTPKTSFYDDFGVYAYVYEGDDWADRRNVKPYFSAEKVTKSGNVWKTDPLRYWPGASYRMHFFAYAPYNSQGVTINTTNNTPVLSYSVPADVKDQKDLVVATADVKGNHNQSVALQFHHILTAVQVKAAEGVSGTIKRVTFTNIQSSGSCTFGETKEDISWTGLRDSKSFGLTFTSGEEPVLDGSKEDFIVNGDSTFMMIPQVLGENATLEVEFENGETLTGSLHGKTDWTIGHTVIYKISKTGDEYELIVEFPKQSEYIAGINANFSYKVTSRKLSGNNNEEFVAWHMEYSIDGGQSWSDNWNSRTIDNVKGYYPTDGNGQYKWLNLKKENSGMNITQTMNSNKIRMRDINNDWDEVSETDKNREWRTDEISLGSNTQPFDLSKYDFYKDPQTESSEVNTANCYVIRHPGTYMFPAVYGNGIKEGQNNESAYNNDVFVKHDGTAITSPFINTENCTPVLIWRDCPQNTDNNNISVHSEMRNGTINGISVKYITFTTADKSEIMQGNAIIGLQNSDGKIVWSWHIWITNNTDVARFTPVTNNSNQIYNVGRLNLGFCNGISYEWADREILIRIKQDESEKTSQEFRIKQLGMNYEKDFNNTFYQWGRKDPIRGYIAALKDVVDYGNKPCFNENGQVSFETGDLSQSYDAIKQPNLFCTNWSYNNNYWGTEKTVYDPCPVGMRIPDAYTFTGFTIDGTQKHWSSTSETLPQMDNGGINTSSASYGVVRNNDHGYYFYCNPNYDSSGGTIFIPFAYCRQTDGRIEPLNTYYYTANPSSGIALTASFVNPTTNSSQSASGGCVRPIKDE